MFHASEYHNTGLLLCIGSPVLLGCFITPTLTSTYNEFDYPVFHKICHLTLVTITKPTLPMLCFSYLLALGSCNLKQLLPNFLTRTLFVRTAKQPIPSMYGISTYIWLNCMVNVVNTLDLETLRKRPASKKSFSSWEKYEIIPQTVIRLAK